MIKPFHFSPLTFHAVRFHGRTLELTESLYSAKTDFSLLTLHLRALLLRHWHAFSAGPAQLLGERNNGGDVLPAHFVPLDGIYARFSNGDPILRARRDLGSVSLYLLGDFHARIPGGGKHLNYPAPLGRQ